MFFWVEIRLSREARLHAKMDGDFAPRNWRPSSDKVAAAEARMRAVLDDGKYNVIQSIAHKVIPEFSDRHRART